VLVLGIETSCDECSVAVVENGKKVLSNIIATQIELHKPFQGVVPELASRLHTEWIVGVYKAALHDAGISNKLIEGIAVTNRPGLIGSLLVGLNFAKALAFSLQIPFIAVDHIRAHLYAPQLESDIDYPFLGLLVSGGHTIICIVSNYDDITVLGTTIDDACGEAFDKVSKFYNMGYPGGVAIDKLAQLGDSSSFNFPVPSLHKGDHQYDVSYSGLKTAVVNQLDQFWNKNYEKSPENIAAAFQKRAIDILLRKLFLAVKNTGIKTVVAGGGVAANSYLRSTLSDKKDISVYFPSLKLCTDNGAMIAGIGYKYFVNKVKSDYSISVSARVEGFRRTYP
jgi:N6-L-threonylcarbamoyladenine synthase